MKVTQEKLPASQIGLEIEITPEMTKQAYEKVIQDLTRSANIPGFRKGKVPRQVLVQRIGSASIKATALEELIDKCFKEALEQEEIEALGNFQLRTEFEQLIQQFQPGAELTLMAAVDVAPTLTLKQSSGFQVQAEEVKPDPERVDKVLREYQEQMATLVPVEGRAAQMEDVVAVNYKGILTAEEPEAEPEPVPGGEAENFQVELQPGKFIEGFIDGIVGMNPGDTKEVPVQFPTDYAAEHLAGRAAVFTITLQEIKEKELPELDDEFAAEVSQFATLAELRESLETQYREEAEEKTRSNQEQAILAALLEQVEVELPETLVEKELSFMINQTAFQLQEQGIDVRKLFTPDTIPLVKERSRPEAITRIQRSLALEEIAKQENIQPDEGVVGIKVNNILADMEPGTIDPDRLRSVIEEELKREKTIAWLIEHSTIELVPEGTLSQEAEAEVIEAAEAIIEAEVAEVVEPEVSEPEVAETVPEDAPAEPIEAAIAISESTPDAPVAETTTADAAASPTPDDPDADEKSATKGRKSKKTTAAEPLADSDS